MTVRPEHRRTFPTSRIAETLLMFLRVHGGENAATNSKFIYRPLADFYDLSEEARHLSRSDYSMGGLKSGLAWDGEVNSAAKDLKKEGYVLSETRSGNSIWRLTPNGMERADFWLKRMTEKKNALSSLRVDPNLCWLESGNQLKEFS
jgi:hypothetical protein